MCRTCGCTRYISSGKKAVLERAAEIVQRLGVTPENAHLYEEGEWICGLVGPRVPLAAEAEIWDIVKMMHEFHERINEERRQTAVAAVKDVFAHFPKPGDPREILTMWHQLEQLQREISDTEINSLPDPSLREALHAMRHVHDRSEERKAEMVKRYGLKSG